MAHVNVDSVGGRGATVLTEAAAMADLRGLACAVIEEQTGEAFVGTRYGRAGDQSFFRLWAERPHPVQFRLRAC